MATVSTKLTADDLWKMPDDGNRYELLDGEIVRSPAPMTKHQRIVVAGIAILLEAERAGYGQVFVAPRDVVLDEHNVVQPDLLFVTNERLSIVTEKNIQGAPDLVIEVLSPSTSSKDLGDKLSTYARFGVRYCWLVSPEAEVIRRFALQGGTFVEDVPLRAGDQLTCPLFPTVSLDVAAFFGR